MSSFLVTGAAGFIGSHVTCALLDAGHTVVGIDSLTDYYDPDVSSPVTVDGINDLIGEFAGRRTRAGAEPGD